MPWCPKCKNEYREGITVCADCNVPLVDSLEAEEATAVVFTTTEEELANRFIDFLKYSQIESGTVEAGDEGEYAVSVKESDFRQAKKLFQGFAIAESENAIKKELEKMQATDQIPSMKDGEGSEDSEESSEELSEEELAQIAESMDSTQNGEGSFQEAKDAEAVEDASLRSPARVYMKQEDKYKDLNSTAYTFLVIGIVGLAFVAANVLGLISFINNIIAGVLYTVIFAGCIFVAFTSFRDAKKAEAGIKEEEDLTAKVNQWMEANISEETFAEVVDENLSDEANYLNKLEHMGRLLTKEFPQLDGDYADQLCEEYYGKKFD